MKHQTGITYPPCEHFPYMIFLINKKPFTSRTCDELRTKEKPSPGFLLKRSFSKKPDCEQALLVDGTDDWFGLNNDKPLIM